jgi:hypothetical protein
VEAAVVDQVDADHPHHLGAEASAVERRVEKQVDGGVAVHRIVLLVPLDVADQLVVEQHGALDHVRLLVQPALLRLLPPAQHAGLCAQLLQTRAVLDRDGHQADAQIADGAP